MSMRYLLFRIKPTWVSILLTLGCLFVAMGSSAAPSGYLYQVLPLLPRDAQIVELSESSAEGRKVDELLLRIFQTPTGKVFCGAVVRDFDEFHRSFFLGQRQAKKAFKACEGHFASRQNHRIFRKQYFLIYTDQKDIAIDGWTTPRNETFVVASRDLKDDRLLQTLIHELTISLDRKEQIGFLGQLDFPGLGIVSGPEACEQLSVIRTGTIKHALSALRAFDLEKRIARELQIELPSGFADWSGMSCVDKLKFMVPYVERIQQSYRVEDQINVRLDRRGCDGQTPANTRLEDKIEYLGKVSFLFKDGTRRNVCEYLSEGWPFFPGASFRGGPGPRIGGGGWIELRKRMPVVTPKRSLGRGAR